MATMLEVMQGRIGIQEMPGKAHNKAILQMAIDAGHPEIIDDETSWCSLSLCSAAFKADMPFPPRNINPMARSWLTWGVKVDPKDVQPGDVAIWPRGDPRGPYGHVNIVETLTKDRRKVICIGGNQSGMKGGDAITRANPRMISEAVGFRRGVAPTVPALRDAGSTTIKNADRKEKVGVLTVFTVPIAKGIEYVMSLFGPTEMVPQFASLPEGLSWWSTVLASANGVLNYAMTHPYLALTVFAGLALWGFSRWEKSKRVAEHKLGVPIASEVAALEAA